MKVSREKIFKVISEERDYQITERKWSPEFDAKNTKNDWVSYICRYACSGAAMDQDTNEFVASMFMVAALAVAAIEAGARNDGYPLRHYDSVPPECVEVEECCEQECCGEEDEKDALM